jgi:hypothetical protein
MRHIRRPLVGLTALFTGAITLDRLGGTHGEAIAAWVYLLAVAAVAAPLALGRSRRGRPWLTLAVVLAPYAVVRLLTSGFPGGPELSPYVAATEMAFLVLTGLLSRAIAVGLDELDDTIGAVAFGDSPALDLDGSQATTEILAEMARSRRHDRPLSVTVLEPAVETLDLAIDHAAEAVQRAVRRRYVYGRLARVIADQLRRSDLLFEHRESGRFVVVSPETEADGSALLITRIREAARSLELELTAGSATFPDQAFTFEQLVLEAEQRLAAPAASPVLWPVEESNRAQVGA